MFVAHFRKTDEKRQSVAEHLMGVGSKARPFAAKIGMPVGGEVLGLLHDFGKFSQSFQIYLASATDQLDQDLDDTWVDAKALKGKIDHSTAGAQWVYQTLQNFRGDGQFGKREELCAQMLALCIASHHSGLIDCIDADGKNNFAKRIQKDDKDTYLTECKANADVALLFKAQSLCTPDLVEEIWRQVEQILKTSGTTDKVKEFQLGLLTRFLFSTLIDADRIDSADFENPQNVALRSQGEPDWNVPIARLESHLEKLSQVSDNKGSEIDTRRREISHRCKTRASERQGIYTLSVPTGGGKTLASLRYALHHAKQHQLERIVYIIPYTSIIEQNAEAVREIIEHADDVRPWVLEHHSNLEPEKQTWQSKLFTENWDSPIVFTTMVQFLEACFAGGTQSPRRFHQLAKSVMVFDEIQTLPIKCVHMFCNTLNFLVDYAQTTALLCTATQPLLDKVPDPKFGELRLSENHELVGDSAALGDVFAQLDRVDIINRCEAKGWPLAVMRDFVLQQFEQTQSVLVIVNTKDWAQKLYLACQAAGVAQEDLFHLSTNQCAAHRKALLDGPGGIKRRLKAGKPVLCISTQLIEAGVDVSFACVVRFLAGLDSIAQAAGRCNRHGELQDANGQAVKGKVFVVQPDKESTEMLTEIEEGKDCASRVLREMADAHLPNKAVSPTVIKQYFQYFFHARKDQMVYPLDDGSGRTLLSLLSDNAGNVYARKNNWRKQNGQAPLLMQSFMEAGKAFKAIDAPTQAVIVQFGRGRRIVERLNAFGDASHPGFRRELKKAQKFSINVFPHVWHKLKEIHAVQPILNEETGIYFLLPQHYDKAFGLNVAGNGSWVY
jgi:CRISPR-associated endonuclease/helicase Cas3